MCKNMKTHIKTNNSMDIAKTIHKTKLTYKHIKKNKHTTHGKYNKEKDNKQ
jgi:hypothetical protein